MGKETTVSSTDPKECCEPENMVGVKCSGSGPDSKVTLIAWYDLNLTGSIPPELGNLTYLEKL
jgi:hypothetical protein